MGQASGYADALDSVPGAAGMNPDEFRATRKSIGLTQTELADRMGVTLRAVQHWEAGTKAISKAMSILLGYVGRAAIRETTS